jgi:hypothetical protein
MYAETGKVRPEAVLSPVPHAVPAGFGSEDGSPPAVEETVPASVDGNTEFAEATLVPVRGEAVDTRYPSANGGREAEPAPPAPSLQRPRRGPQGILDPVTDEMPITFIYVRAVSTQDMRA